MRISILLEGVFEGVFDKAMKRSSNISTINVKQCLVKRLKPDLETTDIVKVIKDYLFIKS